MDGAPDAAAWLYIQGKAAFEHRRYAEALSSFELCLSKLAEMHGRQSEEPFDPTCSGYRHLDDYLDLCRARDAVARANATGAASPTLSSTSPPLSSSAALSKVQRECLIFVCSPRNAPLPHLADEAVDVANVISSHIRRGGSADDLRGELLRRRH